MHRRKKLIPSNLIFVITPLARTQFQSNPLLNGRACRKLSSELLTHGFDRRLLNVSARYVFRSPNL